MKILLLGIGKSGTTALMSAISQAMDVPYEMEPKNLRTLDYDRSFVVKKLIDNYGPKEAEFVARFDRIIFLVRDPRDALISRILYRPYGLPVFADDQKLARYLDVIEQKRADPATVPLLAVINELRRISGFRTAQVTTDLQKRFMEVYRQNEERALLFGYEAFMDGKTGPVEDYIGVTLPREVQVADKFQRVSRSRGYGDWKNWFTDRDTEFFDHLFKDFYAQFGYRPEPAAVDKTISRANSVDYVIRIVNEWRGRRDLPLYPAPQDG